MGKELAQEHAAIVDWVLYMYRFVHKAIWNPDDCVHKSHVETGAIPHFSVNSMLSITLLWPSVGLNNDIYRTKKWMQISGKFRILIVVLVAPKKKDITMVGGSFHSLRLKFIKSL